MLWQKIFHTIMDAIDEESSVTMKALQEECNNDNEEQDMKLVVGLEVQEDEKIGIKGIRPAPLEIVLQPVDILKQVKFNATVGTPRSTIKGSSSALVKQN